MKYYNECNRISRYLDIYPDKPNNVEQLIKSLISSAERYLNLATIQMERIIVDLEEMEFAFEHFRPQSVEMRKPFIKYFSDAEFFINAVHKFFSIVKRLGDTPIGKDVGVILESNKELMEVYRQIRNSFEHIDERILRQDSFIKDISSVVEDTLKTAHGEVKLTPQSLTPLYSIFENLVKSVETMIEPRKEGIDLFWKDFDQRKKEAWDKKYGCKE